MDDSDNNISADGRITLLFVLLSSLLLSDLAYRQTVFRGREATPCEQLYVASADKLALKSCREADGARQTLFLPARFSPFFYAAVPINSSSKEMLMTVKGIGSVLAEDILAYRRHSGPFTSREDLLKIPGIGQKRAARFAKDLSFTTTP